VNNFDDEANASTGKAYAPAYQAIDLAEQHGKENYTI
jgi:hypothetical protein